MAEIRAYDKKIRQRLQDQRWLVNGALWTGWQLAGFIPCIDCSVIISRVGCETEIGVFHLKRVR